MQIVLITGSSSGVGYETALTFARNGFKVIATMPHLEKSEALNKKIKEENLNVDIKQLDVTNEKNIKDVVDDVLKTYGKIDILVNNAGAGLLGTLEQTKLSQAHQIMNVNYFGVRNVTNAVLPSMRKNTGRIISITSVGGIIGQPFNADYCAAKFAVEGLMESLAPEMKRLGIKISVVEPGPINTNFISSTLERSYALSNDLKPDYQEMLDAYTDATKKVFANGAQDPAEVAKLIFDIALVDKPHFRYQTSDLSRQVASLKLTDSTGDKIVAISGSRLPEKITRSTTPKKISIVSLCEVIAPDIPKGIDAMAKIVAKKHEKNTGDSLSNSEMDILKQKIGTTIYSNVSKLREFKMQC